MTKIFYSLLLLSGFLLATSCNNREKEFASELQLLDSLENDLSAMEKWMILDAKEIEQRYKQMEENTDYFKAHFKDTISLELALAFDQYHGAEPIYKNYIRHHIAIEKEHKELTEQVKNLRHSLLKGEVTRPDFKVYYAKESQETEALEEHVNDIYKKVLEVEPMYKRAAAVIDAEVTSLRKKETK